MNIQLSEVMMSYPHNFLHISFTENDKNLIFRYVTVNVTFYPPKINEKWCLFWYISIQGYAFICIRKKKKIENFQNFIYMTNCEGMISSAGQEVFSENMGNFKMS